MDMYKPLNVIVFLFECIHTHTHTHTHNLILEHLEKCLSDYKIESSILFTIST